MTLVLLAVLLGWLGAAASVRTGLSTQAAA
jgi:hypothetical protein